jgi:hypothetical protein
MYVTIGTLQKKVKNLTLTVREFNKRIVPCEQQVLIELAIILVILVTFMSCSNEKTILLINDDSQECKLQIITSCQ